MTKEEAFNIELPKWPQCVITGDRITKEQAMEIIRRTDMFFFGCGGNNVVFEDDVKKILGIPAYDYSSREDFDRYWNEMIEFREKSKLVSLSYLHNNWISCCWVGGPHGWCSPEGEIGFQNNIGKWPSVEEIYEDLKSIGENFPYVNLTCTIINSEEDCYDEDTESLITMMLKDGEVTFLEPIPIEELEYGGVKCDYSIGYENYFTLEEIKKWWGNK